MNLSLAKHVVMLAQELTKTAEDIDMSMMKLDPCDPEVKNRATRGLSTNAGSGGARDRLVRYLRVLSRLSPIMRFLIKTCCLHGHSLFFKRPVEKCFMLGGVKINLLQLLHAVNVLENEFEVQELKSVWIVANR